MPSVEGIYTLGVKAASRALPMLARGEGKLARGIRGRAGLLERMARWASEGRDPGRPLAWFHASSVGEGLQARAVVEAFRVLRPDAQVVYTYFSPSAESFARRVPADFADFLPLDLPAAVAAALDHLRPGVVAFSKHDVWPNLTRGARARGVRLVLLSATLPAGSSRLRAPARIFLRPAYQRLDAVAAISAEDADRFAVLGVPAERRSVMGDARFDQVQARAEAADLDAPLLRGLRAPGRITLVAGSTWPADERHLLEAWSSLGLVPRRLVLVPHEPTEAHLAGAEQAARGAGLTATRLSAGPGAEAEVVLVDRVGVLGDLYALADLAYVGGGWGRAGLHSVLEPAAFGAPVLFGPHHANAREAGELVRRGGAFAAADPADLRRHLHRLVQDDGQREAAGRRARGFVEDGLGAARRGAALVAALLPGG